MRLPEYVDVGNRDTFCQWIETKTRVLGSIKGGSSYKFGIFKRKRQPEPEQTSTYWDDGEYTWIQRYGKSRNEAFDNIKREIVKVIRFAMSGDFEAIDAISISNMFKWKIAFLYSNERLIPIYEIETLGNIAENFGVDKWKPQVSQIQRTMIDNKPANTPLYEYMEDLWFRFNTKGRADAESPGERITESKTSPRQRRATSELNIDSQMRTVSRSFMVEKKHNLIQQALYNNLVEAFGHERVFLEEDFVDVKLVQPDSITLYEVKSSSYASQCIREAIGQLLFYALQLQDRREKRLVVVGQYPPNSSEVQLLEQLKRHIRFDLSYEHVQLM